MSSTENAVINIVSVITGSGHWQWSKKGFSLNINCFHLTLRLCKSIN